MLQEPEADAAAGPVGVRGQEVEDGGDLVAGQQGGDLGQLLDRELLLLPGGLQQAPEDLGVGHGGQQLAARLGVGRGLAGDDLEDLGKGTEEPFLEQVACGSRGAEG